MQRDLKKLSKFLNEVEDKCQEAQQISLDLLDQIKLKDESIRELSQKIDDQGDVFVYKPVDGDLVDQKLAAFINMQPIKMRAQLQFIRESEGQYKYGRKRVFMKIEQGSIIIRVGGGYLTIEDFIEQYCEEGKRD